MMMNAVLVFVLALAAALVADARPPENLANFQNNYACNGNETLILRPHSLEDIANAIRSHEGNLQAVGRGHSWNQPFFCAAPSGEVPGVNIAVTSLIDPDVDLSEYIFVNETDMSVVVAAGISQRVLLDYLAAYGTENGGDGYTLSAFAWYIDQSMGGAIATDTHGSSLTHGSLSSREQLTDLWIMTANGTVLHLNDEINEHLMSAARVSVGRLGVILYAKLNIIPQTMILRTSDELDEQTVLDDLLAISDAYRETGKLPLDELNDVNFFWFPQASSFYRVSFRPDDQAPPVGEAPGPDDELMADGIETATSGTSGLGYARDFVNDVLLAGDAPLEPMFVDSFSGPEGIEASLPEIPPGIEREGPSAWTVSFRGFGAAVFKGVFYNTQISTGSFPRRTAYIAQTDEQDFIGIQYDQYELAVPLENAGTCLRGVVDLIESLDARDSILTPPLIRFVSESPAYLSHTSDGPAIFINVEDYVFYNDNRGETANEPFQAMLTYIRTNPECTGGPDKVSKMHWGKAGWPDVGCFDGASEFGEGWCHFGCAVRTLDPDNVFQPNSEAFRWNMTTLDLCCDDVSGFQVDMEGCALGCAGDEPYLRVVSSKSTSEAVAVDKEDEDRCKYPPLHPKLREPELW